MSHIDIGIVEAMENPALFGPHFAGDSWSTWRAVLKATFGEPMLPAEREVLWSVAERAPPTKRVKEAVYIVGRGGGKDSIASLIAAYVAVTFDPRGKLRPGEHATVMLLAVDRDQAGIAFNYIRGLFEETAALKPMIRDIGRDTIELRNGVEIVVHTNSFRSVRGRSILCAILDEVAMWRDNDSANPDAEVYAALKPGMRVPGAMMILISTAYRRSGLLYDQHAEHYGDSTSDGTLVVRGTTEQFNPTADLEEIARLVESNPAKYNAEFNSVWRDDLSSFITRDLLERAVDTAESVRPPVAGVEYHAFCDPSGGGPDEYTMARTWTPTITSSSICCGPGPVDQIRSRPPMRSA
jgi:hypothetical protein